MVQNTVCDSVLIPVNSHPPLSDQTDLYWLPLIWTLHTKIIIHLKLFICLSECWKGAALNLEVFNAWSLPFCPGILYSNHSGRNFCPWLSPRQKQALSWPAQISPMFITLYARTLAKAFWYSVCIFEITYFYMSQHDLIINVLILYVDFDVRKYIVKI